jgi:tetratricopeptide (TPR) repeat protein
VNPYQAAADLSEAGKLEQAWKLVGKMLIDNPMDMRALVTASYIMRRLGSLPQAYHFAKAAAEIDPQECGAWTNWGHVASEMWLEQEAERYYRKGLECAKIEKNRISLLVNLSALYIDTGRFKEAEEITREILAIDPAHQNASANLGFCQLAQRNWEGWRGYRLTIGSDWRPKVQYRDEPEWDGTPGQTVALYADQGLGDEVSFASMLPDAIKACKKVILDCDERLEGLFKRSFPQAKVYGTRRAKDGRWDKEDWQIDASLPLGQIGEYYRTRAEDFPGVPYLVPCPARVQMWNGLFAGKKKPRIGIAWTGGIAKTNARNRRIALEDFVPLFRKVPAHYVSLQYKDAEAEIRALKARHRWVDLEQYKWGTLTQDYDDTAALIASLDYVVCIQTAVAHTAGALGIPVAVMVPVATQWRYGDSEDSIPWYKSLRVVRQKESGSWGAEIERTATELRTYFASVQGGTGADAPDDELRDGKHRLRSAGVPDRQSNGHHPPSGLRLRGADQSRPLPEG